ncbi:MAG: isoaspartyl peptidase/L-asparaginase [Opitutales bacterium]|nr:isoaspartyl peptidase/L-asparaginase [Opitutales bacterium]
MKAPMALALHGGAGVLTRAKLNAGAEREHRAALRTALDHGWGILRAGGSALDAIEAVTCDLEDCPLFNAGRGAVYTLAGTHEMDAAVMCGRDSRVGAVAGVTAVRNPISLARAVMERSGAVLLAGRGAEAFASECGFSTEPPAYFHTDARREQLERARRAGRTAVDHDGMEEKYGTVGAVALDASGNLAAATSTGGITNKRPGRVGDSPVPGAGTYADNNTCAVSCTGEGEAFLRCCAAHEVAARMRHGGAVLTAAAEAVIHTVLPGKGGLIAVDRSGAVALPFNTEGMFRAWRSTKETEGVAIFRDA